MFMHPEDKIAVPGAVWHGVAIGWHDDINPNMSSVQSDHDRLVSMKLSTDITSFLLISFYAPTAGKDEEFLESVSYLSTFIVQNVTAGDNVIIGTDCNCSDKSTSRRQQCWNNFCQTFSLKQQTTGLPTFHHNNGISETSIDMFVTSESVAIQDLNQLCTLEDPLNLSSHDPISASIMVSIASEMDGNKYEKSYTNFAHEKINWEECDIKVYQTLASQALSEAQDYWDTPEVVPFLTELFSKLLVNCSKLATNPKPTKRKPKEQALLPRTSRNVRKAEAALKRTFKRWKTAGRPSSDLNPDRKAYKTARSSLQALRRYEDNLTFIRYNNTLMQSTRHDKSKVYSMMKRQRGSKTPSHTTLLHTPTGTYYGGDVLEGFAADAENLARETKSEEVIDKQFYRLCKLDNEFIFEIEKHSEIRIPPMNLKQLEEILTKRMKLRKSCDIYQLTVEHLRYSGTEAKEQILKLINRILSNLSCLACPQLKLGLGTAIHKGKNKPFSKSSSYRRITVTPILGAIIDYYVEPPTEAIFRLEQSPDQLGFTSGLSYLMAAVQRGECQRWAVDRKMTCFGVSLDGESAFPSVERTIQVRELYAAGERGDYLSYSRNTYKNTECHIKIRDKLSRRIRESKGNRQGHVKASGHFKAYINPLLNTLNRSGLGFQLGPLCITTVCIADDTYVLTNSPSKLQSALKIVSHYGKRYQLKFNVDKTKIVTTGSKIDMNFYQETQPWTLNGDTIDVVDTNEHLGLLVSGQHEEQKNVDKKLQLCRNSLFGLLGAGFAYKCMISPTVQLHLWRTYSLPVLLSGLCTLPLRPSNMKSLTIFQNKVHRGFLKLSQSSPVPCLYFLLSELPIEARIHISTLNTFHTILSHPDTTVHKIIKYVLRMCESNSTTWSHHIKILSEKYDLPCPLLLLEEKITINKESWKLLVKTNITAFHERRLREASESNSKMQYLNVKLLGLAGRPHPALQHILTTQDVRKLRVHLKFLVGDYYHSQRLALDQPHLSPACKLCSAPVESTEHVLGTCSATAECRDRILPELLNTVAAVQPSSHILLRPTKGELVQFILDCTSPNLGNNLRIPTQNPRVFEVFRVSRDWCFAISKERIRQLSKL